MELNLLNIAIYLYAPLCIVFSVLWVSKLSKKTKSSKNHLPFSILIPVRNEAKNIERLISSIIALNYPKDKYELILIDDYSEDDTQSLAEKSLSQSGLNYLIIKNDITNGSPKKRAITKAIELAKYEHIICTDGDCEIPKNWLNSFNKIYEQNDAMFVSGPVTFLEPSESSFWRVLWNRLQVVEFASLVGAGASAIWLKSPNMCSGANISYTKSAFRLVDGYTGNEQIASGDDEFLMHKIAAIDAEKIFYNADQDAVILTNDQSNLKSFYSQRKRWAGKWTFYKSIVPKLLAIFIFGVNVSTIWAMFTLDFETLTIRWIAEILFLVPVLLFLKKWKEIWYIIPLQFIYPFYVLIFGMSSIQKDSYTWKGRKLS
ncbi:Glycosyltransferase, catalytic subunit of cellulose synthase and poly-beta-1,6-N-acetylglucosamine synthase [Spirosomataceae bacterium TFI 002]|nr:Glycosyltransferase, catalytic subunit of cellulose synthase and poly-beta-1,6-N-acetylglucosamine synthase [Spirosomataceae bacterium TFI 002]